MTAPALWPWLQAFAFTQIVEVPIYRRMTGCTFWVAFGASALTHPFVWFAFPNLPLRYDLSVGLSEVFAVGVEAGYLRVLRLPRPLLSSLIANLASLGLGMLSRYLFGRP